MLQKFSKKWKASTQPRKQRKYRYSAPAHIRIKFLRAPLSKELRKKHNKRATLVRKGDKVKILRGQFKGKSGKVESVDSKREKLYIENIQLQKTDGSKSHYPIHPSKVQITELKLDDKKRSESLKRK